MANPVISIFRQTLSPRAQFLLSAIFVLAVGAFPAWAQQAGGDSSQTPASAGQETTTPAPTPSTQRPDTAVVKPTTPAEVRQAQLVADTNRLYQLAQELQSEVAKSSKDTLSLAVVKKAAEVEKLAKSLKERMKTE